jgi:hypothetical protein
VYVVVLYVHVLDHNSIDFQYWYSCTAMQLYVPVQCTHAYCIAFEHSSTSTVPYGSTRVLIFSRDPYWYSCAGTVNVLVQGTCTMYLYSSKSTRVQLYMHLVPVHVLYRYQTTVLGTVLHKGPVQSVLYNLVLVLYRYFI